MWAHKKDVEFMFLKTIQVKQIIYAVDVQQQRPTVRKERNTTSLMAIMIVKTKQQTNLFVDIKTIGYLVLTMEIRAGMIATTLVTIAKNFTTLLTAPHRLTRGCALS